MVDYKLSELIIEYSDDDQEEEKKLTVYEYSLNNSIILKYFIGKEIGKLIGYKNIGEIIKNSVSKSNQITFREYKGEKIPKLNPRVILITQDGVMELLLKTHKKISPKAENTLSLFDIKINKYKIQKNTEEEGELKELKELTELTEYYYISEGLMFEYFIGYEITALIGYINPNKTIKDNVSKCNQLQFREYPGVKIPLLDPRVILITRDGAVEILIKTRKRISSDVLHMLKKFGIETTNKKCLTKEQQTLSSIANAFKTEKFNDQKNVGKYNLDMYFDEYRFPTECDEYDHQDRKPENERERMDFVNKELEIDDSYWIRFNPDEKDFDVIKVISKIHTMMKIKGVWKKPIIKYVDPTKFKKNKNVLNLDPEKPCNMCGLVKKLEEFNSALSHRDKRENVCTICRRKRQAEILVEQKNEMETKNITEIKCNLCGEDKKLDDFYNDKNSPTGHMRRCKICHINRLKVLVEVKDKIIITDKKCSCCKEVKSVLEFYKLLKSVDGYKIYCKDCEKLKAKILYDKKNKSKEE
jgi:very-short-patch-repair endonuclease